MKFLSYKSDGVAGLAVETDGAYLGLNERDAGYPGSLQSLIDTGGSALDDAGAILSKGNKVDLEAIEYLPPLSHPEKIVCVGLNYLDHTSETSYKQPDYPTLFNRYNSSLTGHGRPIVRPRCSEQLDFEGELVAVISRTARHVSEEEALGCVAGYSIFNDASIRDYQFKSPQWTPGKNFDDTGAFGPVFVTADELPQGCKGLRLRTRLNGEVVQDAMIDDMVFPIARQIAICSEFMTLVPGDVLVTGTPAGVGFGRDPKLWMKHGDVCEVEIDRIGTLTNPIVDE